LDLAEEFLSRPQVDRDDLVAQAAEWYGIHHQPFSIASYDALVLQRRNSEYNEAPIAYFDFNAGDIEPAAKVIYEPDVSSPPEDLVPVGIYPLRCDHSLAYSGVPVVVGAHVAPAAILHDDEKEGESAPEDVATIACPVAAASCMLSEDVTEVKEEKEEKGPAQSDESEDEDVKKDIADAVRESALDFDSPSLLDGEHSVKRRAIQPQQVDSLVLESVFLHFTDVFSSLIGCTSGEARAAGFAELADNRHRHWNDPAFSHAWLSGFMFVLIIVSWALSFGVSWAALDALLQLLMILIPGANLPHLRALRNYLMDRRVIPAQQVVIDAAAASSSEHPVAAASDAVFADEQEEGEEFYEQYWFVSPCSFCFPLIFAFVIQALQNVWTA
jgi:hypothetical protein